jgi:hypothetical protein
MPAVREEGYRYVTWTVEGEGAAPAQTRWAEVQGKRAFVFHTQLNEVICMDEACCKKHCGAARRCSASRSEIYEACYLCLTASASCRHAMCQELAVGLCMVFAATSCGDLLVDEYV